MGSGAAKAPDAPPIQALRPMARTDRELERFDACFTRNGAPRDPAVLRWQYLDNPTGELFVDFALAEGDDLAAIYASIPVVFRIAGARRLGIQSVDTMTDARFRGRGLFLELANRTYARAASAGVALVYGTPNGSSAHGFFQRRHRLAQQVATQSSRYGQNMRLRTVCVFGGAPYPPQNRELERGVDVLVATPGRLLDHLDRGRVDLSKLKILILDEGDRMLDMGFQDDVDRICALAPAARQTVLFSATFDGAIGRLAARLTREAARIDVRAEGSAPIAIEQRVHFADDSAHKYRLLDRLLADVGPGQSIIFMSTRRDAEALANRLQDEGHTAAALHGDMHQRERDRTLTRLRRGGVRTLVATDVAARGIDVPGVTQVINFDLPRQAENYVHRIGRTGRAGASGIAVSLANPTERGTLRQIERYTGSAIPAHVIPGLEPRARNQNAAARRPQRGGIIGGRGVKDRWRTGR